MKKICYTTPGGNLRVVHPAPWARFVRLAGEENQQVASFDVFARTYKVTALEALPSGLKAEWAETEDEFVARIAKKDVPADMAYQVVEESAIPADRAFRNAWKLDGNAVSHDMAKCRAIHRERLRELRAPKLAALDAEWFKAVEAGDTEAQAAITAKKNALRDVTKDPAIDAAKTPEELKAIRVA